MDHPVATKHRLAIASATKYTKIEKYMKIPGRLKYHHRSKKKTPNHHPLIISISQHHHHISQSFLPKHTRDVTNTSLEKFPKHHQKTNKTISKQHQDITQKTETRPSTKT